MRTIEINENRKGKDLTLKPRNFYLAEITDEMLSKAEVADDENVDLPSNVSGFAFVTFKNVVIYCCTLNFFVVYCENGTIEHIDNQDLIRDFRLLANITNDIKIKFEYGI